MKAEEILYRLPDRERPPFAELWCQQNPGARKILVPALFWYQYFSGVSKVLMSAKSWCQKSSGATTKREEMEEKDACWLLELDWLATYVGYLPCVSTYPY